MTQSTHGTELIEFGEAEEVQHVNEDTEHGNNLSVGDRSFFSRIARDSVGQWLGQAKTGRRPVEKNWERDESTVRYREMENES